MTCPITSAWPSVARTGELKRYFRDKGWSIHVPRDLHGDGGLTCCVTASMEATASRSASSERLLLACSTTSRSASSKPSDSLALKPLRADRARASAGGRGSRCPRTLPRAQRRLSEMGPAFEVQRDHHPSSEDPGGRIELNAELRLHSSGALICGASRHRALSLHRGLLRSREAIAKSSSGAYGRPAPGAGARAMSTWVPRPWSMSAGPVHSLAIMNRVALSGPPSAQAKQPRSSSIRLQDLAAFADAHAPLVRHVRVPDGVLRVGTDAVRYPVAELGPHPPVRQASVGRDVERREPLGIGLGDDQRPIVGHDEHAVREGQAVGDLASRAVRGDERDDPRGVRPRRPSGRSRRR